VKKYVLKVKDVQDGLADEILPKNREIIQPSRVLSEPVRQKIHEHLESNIKRPKKQRITAKRIWELLIEDGHKISYSSVKNEVSRWKRTNAPREVFILQEPRVGQRVEFDYKSLELSMHFVLHPCVCNLASPMPHWPTKYNFILTEATVDRFELTQ
jgi:hypothetical protein